MAQAQKPRDILRDKLNGIAVAARRDKNETGSLTSDDVAELLAMTNEGDAAKAFVMNIAKNRQSVSLVKIADDALVLAAQWAAASSA
jgi:hypothetical protein